MQQVQCLLGAMLKTETGHTSDVGRNGFCRRLVIGDERAPKLAVVLPERVWNFHYEPMIQQYQLRLLPPPAKPSVPEACMCTD